MARQSIALLLLVPLLSACLSTQRVPMVHKLHVTTTPERAHIWREDKAGRQAVGQAPFLLEERYERVTMKASTATWVAWVAMVLLSGAGFVLGAVSDNSTAKVLGYVAGGTLAPYAVLAPIALFGGPRDVTPHIPLTLGASAPGYSDGWLKLKIPPLKKKGEPVAGEQKVHITLAPGGGSKVVNPATAPVAAAEPQRPIVAVFDLADNKHKLDATTMGELAEYLATQLTATGRYRTVPRSQLRRRLGKEKRQGYKACFDEACQIELGKAMAAQKSLATKIIRVGKICTLTSVLYDLKTETSERAATTEGPCSTEGLLASLRAQALKIARVKPLSATP